MSAATPMSDPLEPDERTPQQAIAGTLRILGRQLLAAALPGVPDEDIAHQLAVLHEEDQRRHPEEGVWIKLR